MTAHRHLTRRRVLKSGALAVTGSLCGPWMPVLLAEASGTEQSWTLENDLVRRVVAFDPARGLSTSRLTLLATRREYAGKEGPAEFSFLCNGQPCAANDGQFELVDARTDAIAGGKSLTVRLRSRKFPLEVAAVHRMYDGHPALRKHLLLRNTGTSTLLLTHLNVETLDLDLGPENEITLLTQYGTVPREIFYTGRSEDAGLLVKNAMTGDGMAIVSEVPGYMKRTEIAGWDTPDGVRISIMYDTDLMPFERRIGAGRGVRHRRCIAGSVSRGRRHSTIRNGCVPCYTAQVLERRVDARGRHGSTTRGSRLSAASTTAIALELIDAAGAMGMDIFTIDDGWQQEYGENTVNLTAFPGGLEPILNAVEHKGMRLGLWMPIAAIGTSTAEYRKHPEWACAGSSKARPRSPAPCGGQKAVMCMASPYRDAAAARDHRRHRAFPPGLCQARHHHHLQCLWRSAGMLGQGSRPRHLGRVAGHASTKASRMSPRKIYREASRCVARSDFRALGAEAHHRCGPARGRRSRLDEQRRRRHPDSAGPRQARQLLYAARRHPCPSKHADRQPPRASCPRSRRALPPPSVRPRCCSAICANSARPTASGTTRKSDGSSSCGDRVKISESFFPLGSWRQTSPAAWDGFARLARSGDGVIALFRNKSAAPEAVVQLPLVPEGKYRVRSVITGKDVGIYDRAAWTRGVSFSFPGPVQMLELQRSDDRKSVAAFRLATLRPVGLRYLYASMSLTPPWCELRC